MDIEQLLTERARLVDTELPGLLLDIKPPELAAAVTYAIASKGKRIRPALVTLACEAVGGRAEDASFAAASIELIHSSSLVLDDVIDKSEKRRGQDTIHKKWGVDMALLTVQILAALSLKIASRDPRLIHAISDSLYYMGEGEAMELVDFAKDKKSYLELAFRKTGSLFGSAAEVGAVVGGGDEEQIKNFTEFGSHLGMAFQIRDDILDCISKEEDLGKPVKKDLFMGRPSIVVLDALKSGISLERMMKCNNGELMHLVSDSIDYAQEIAREELDLAKSRLEPLDESSAKRKLVELGEYIITRSK
ncbi:MAG: polyprenyl synthetase family protein [Candidatus Methanoperedens sp.]|nr:polyprenyl synthetase family protein [Candidatus Methanoperedens sp.]MCZ7371352.1 polyprenyl synthetase family protein [Candidatus Methanoperedens sp.]